MSKGFQLRSDNGTKMEFTKLNPKQKSYDVLVKADSDNCWYKVGIIRDIDRLRKVFNYD